MSMHRTGGIKDKIRGWLSPAVAAVLLAAAVWVLHRELRSVRYHAVMEALGALKAGHILMALIFTAANYLVLSSYDLLAFHHVGKSLARRRIALTALVSYAVSNSVGFAVLSGTAVRYRFYSRWGVSMTDLARVVVFNSTT